MSGTILVVTSGKGGVGKSTTTLNLGVALGVDGHSVALVDADLGMANLGGMLDVESEPTLHDVLAGDADVESAVVGEEAVEVVPGARDLTEYARADPERLPGVLRTLADQHEFVVVDASAGLGYADVMPIDAADEVVLVTTPEETAVGNTAKLVEFAGVIDARIRGLVVTRVDEAIDPDAVATTVGADLLGAVPEDPAVPASIDASVALEHHAPDSPAATAYRRLADAVTEDTADAVTEGTADAVTEDTADTTTDDTPGDDTTDDTPGDGTIDDTPGDDTTDDTADVKETTGEVASTEADPHPEDDGAGGEQTPGETETAAEEEPSGEDQPAEGDELPEDDTSDVDAGDEADSPEDGGSADEESTGEESADEESTGEESADEESTGEESADGESTGAESSDGSGSGGLFARLRGLFR
jgi:septum site-determining protein MinD